MTRNASRTRLRIIALSCLMALGCHSCNPPQEPDEHNVPTIRDPYEHLPARGTTAQDDRDRTAAVLSMVSKDLGYGDVPEKVFRARLNETWTQRLIIFLSHGGTPQLHAAWSDVKNTCVEAAYVPMPMKAMVRQAEARSNDMEALKMPEAVLRREYLAEIVWIIYQLNSLTPNAPKQ